MNNHVRFVIVFGFFVALSSCASKSDVKPNILFFITDDQSWAHTSYAGELAIETKGFDRIAKEGIYFENAFCASPSCSPSRGSIITGQEFWRLGEAAQLYSAPSKALAGLSFPLILQKHGYHIGYTMKGWAPNDFKVHNWDEYPIGDRYNTHSLTPPADGIVNNDYAANFKDFLNVNNQGKPFFFWYGASEPHRRFELNSGVKNGIDLNKVKVPGFLPDHEVVQNDVADYLLEIQWADQHFEMMLQHLEEKGILENTIIIVTSDNGMPFPNAKNTLNEYGVHMPLAIRWGSKIKNSGRSVKDLISLTDLAPTILAAADITIPYEMTGKDLAPVFYENKLDRDYVCFGKERHTISREGDMDRGVDLGYPQRGIRDQQYLYIKNYFPDRWPSGSPDLLSSHGTYYGDVDGSTTKTFMIENKEDALVAKLFQLAFGKHPAEELYDIIKDPFCLKNLADNEMFLEDKKRLANALVDFQIATEDPRETGGAEAWEHYPYRNRNNPEGLVPFPRG